MRRNRLLTLLALLITAATGAWAEVWTGGTYTATTNELPGSITVSENATLTLNQGANLFVDDLTVNAGKKLTIVGPGHLLVYDGTRGTGHIIIKGDAQVEFHRYDGDDNDSGKGGNGSYGTTCSVTIYSGNLDVYGGNGGAGTSQGGDGGNAFDGSGTLTYYGGTVTTYRGVGGSYTDDGGAYGNEGKSFASTYNVVFMNDPAALTDRSYDPITVNQLHDDETDVIIQGSSADPVPGKFNVKMAAGTADAANWTGRAGGTGTFQVLPLKDVTEGTGPVELKYAGDRVVKRVTATVTPKWKGDLSKIFAADLDDDGVTVLVADGMTLTGTLSKNYKITIADGATVTLDGVTINGVNDDNCNWAGLTCLGDATIILADGTENMVTGFFYMYPGIQAAVGKKLTIQGAGEGKGKLTASSNGYAAGIGGGFQMACGNIEIQGGVITATGGQSAAGIGGAYVAACGNIDITGGTVTATGGQNAAGIGSGSGTSCGAITITDGVTLVTATKGDGAPYSIGAGNESTCGTVTIGGTVYWQDGQAVNDGATYLAQDEIEYPTPPAFAANEYNEASWDGSKVVFTKKTVASTPTAVANSNTAVTWSDGWYTVAGEVTINGNVTLGADTYLILQDGAKLTINGQLDAYSNQKNLSIYGQRKGDGKLNVICNDMDAINGEIGKTVEIHGGEITAEGKYLGLAAGYLKVFSGKITAICSSYGYMGIGFMDSCDVYGGEIEATTNNSSGVSSGIFDGGNGGTFTVYGGKVKGTGNGVQGDPYYGSGFSVKVKSGTAGIKFYFSDNGTDWDEGTYYGTATAAPRKKYAKAE